MSRLWEIAAACMAVATIVSAVTGHFSWWFALAALAFACRAALGRQL